MRVFSKHENGVYVLNRFAGWGPPEVARASIHMAR
jgi:hypothetical protein